MEWRTRRGRGRGGEGSGGGEDCVGTSFANGKNVLPAVKCKKLNKQEHCGQHPGDMAVLTYKTTNSDYISTQ
jgi:hypothetical protein